jgi:ATP-binding cassette subfamily C protein CydD
VLLVTAPLIPLFMVLIGRAAGTLAQRQHAALSLLGAHFLDVLQGLTTLKLFNRSARQTDVIARVTDEFRAATMRVLRVAFLSAFTLELLATLSVAVVAVEIAVRLLYGSIGFETALFLLVIAPEFYQPLRALGARFHAGAAGTAAAERVYALLDTPLPARPAVTDSVPAAPLPIRFDRVHFAYDSGARPALSGVSFDIHPGERVALVGASGAGKSTCAALLLAFLTPDAGHITLNGADLARLDAAAWREHVAWVAQAPHLFNASAADNIALGRRGAAPAAIEAAARAAEAHDFIAALPDGYHTILGENGARLSGGQAQRIAIARAFLKDAPLLVLDEITAHLDAQTEAAVQAALDRLLRGRAALVIAHRLHTVMQADRIIVLDAGRIVEAGTHAELMAGGRAYRALVEGGDA